VIDLKTIGEAIKLQDNRATRDPLFIVFQKREIVTDEDYDYDFIGWYDEDGHRADSRLEDKLNRAYSDPKSGFYYSDEVEMGETGDDEEETITWRRVPVKEVDEFVTACFTEKGCLDYLLSNRHNLNKPFTYVASLFRNNEMISIREHLMNLE
jgi:hypothetical protein